MNIGDIPAQLFSPAKMFYVAYVILVALKILQTTKIEFFLITLLFLGLQIWHDDYWRIRLNAKAKKAEGIPVSDRTSTQKI